MRKVIKLGDRVKDSITGFKGIAIARSEWLNGCQRIEIQPEILKDGKVVEADWFDIRQVVLIKAKAFPKQERREGPMNAPKLGQGGK